MAFEIGHVWLAAGMQCHGRVPETKFHMRAAKPAATEPLNAGEFFRIASLAGDPVVPLLDVVVATDLLEPLPALEVEPEPPVARLAFVDVALVIAAPLGAATEEVRVDNGAGWNADGNVL